MKILLLDSTLDGHHAEYASYIVEHLQESGDDVSLATPADEQAKARLLALAPSLQIHNIRTGVHPPGANRWDRAWRSYQDVHHGFQLADELRADVFHHLYLDGSEFAWLGAPRSNRRRWASLATLFWLPATRRLHDSLPIHAPTPAVKRRLLRSCLRGHRLDRVFVHSERSRRALLRLIGPRMPARTVTLIPDPAPLPSTVSVADARSQLQLTPRGPLLLFFGGLRDDKGPDLFLEALRTLPGDWTAVVAGEPLSITEEEVKRLVSRLPDPSRVLLRLGHIPGSEVPAYFAAADVVVLPYRRSFGGTSGVLMRAVAAGRPIVATDVGDVGSIVRTHGLGIVVRPESPQDLASGLAEFLGRSEEITRDVGPGAMRYAQESDWRVMARGVRDTYLNLTRRDVGS
jgi:glycosyltransferase involved in cell wall biosynthesis